MLIHVVVKNESGYDQAIEGLSYNKLQPLEKMPRVLEKLAPLGLGHNKCLRMIQIWIELRASRFFWQEWDTYKVGTTASSESTMHTIHKRLLTPDDFEDCDIDAIILDNLNARITGLQNATTPENRKRAKIKVKRALPEGFLQKRMVNLNYEVVRNMILQRKNHELPHWQEFILGVLSQLEHPELLPKIEG